MAEQTAEHAASKGRGTAGYSPLDMAVESFLALTKTPFPLQLESLEVGHGASVSLDDLQAYLLDPELVCRVRDVAWRALAARARSEDPAWVVGAVGVAAPRLRRITAALTAGCAADRTDSYGWTHDPRPPAPPPAPTGSRPKQPPSSPSFKPSSASSPRYRRPPRTPPVRRGNTTTDG